MSKLFKMTTLTTLLSMLICVNTISNARTVFEDDNVIVKYKDSKPYYQDEARGWFFYEEPTIINKEEEKEEEVKAVAPPPPVIEEQKTELRPSERLREQGKAYEDAVALAVLEPSPENYKNYMVWSKKILGQAEVFADGVQDYTYTDSSLDARLNTNQGADFRIKDQISKQEKDVKLSALAQDKALIFYYRSDCPYCNKYAPIIKEFSENTGFMVVPMALDNKPLLPHYPQFRVDNNLAKRLEVGAVPALYLLDPKQNNVTTIGFGLSDYDTLTDKIIAASERDFAKTQLDGGNQ